MNTYRETITYRLFWTIAAACQANDNAPGNDRKRDLGSIEGS
jgi:hypothetical protein